MYNGNKQRGFPLIELLATLAIATILLLLSANAFSRLQQQERGRQAIATFSSLFQFARSTVARCVDVACLNVSSWSSRPCAALLACT